MASNNILLGHSGGHVHGQEPQRRGGIQKIPGWLFHEDFPARIFNTQTEYDAAIAAGWVDSPAKVNLLPGQPPPKPDSVQVITPEEAADLPTGTGQDEVPPAPEVFVCDICGKAFDKKQALAMHKMSHRAKV